jgi:hypothetical protein
MTTIARAVLTSGSQHEDVHELGRLLADAGHENSVSRGENPFGLVDESILTAVNNYRNDGDVEPEADIPGVPTHERTRWIGPNLWAALLDDEPEPEPEPEPDAQALRAGPVAAKRKTKVRTRRRVWVKAHCRRRPEDRWLRQQRRSKAMPF